MRVWICLGLAVRAVYGLAVYGSDWLGSQGWECCVPVGYLRVSRGLAVMVMHGGARRGKARSGVAVEVVLGQGLFCYGGVRLGSQGGAWSCIVCWGELRRGMAVVVRRCVIRSGEFGQGSHGKALYVEARRGLLRRGMAV